MRWYEFSRVMMTEEYTIDWSKCDLVESVSDRLSGTPVLKNTRMPVQAIVNNYEDGLDPNEIAEAFEIEVSVVNAVLEFVGRQRAYIT